MSKRNLFSDNEDDILFLLFNRLKLKDKPIHWVLFICNDGSLTLSVPGHDLKEISGYKCYLCNGKFYFENNISAFEKQNIICQHGRDHIKQSNLMPFI